jgi:Zn-dependent protease
MASRFGDDTPRRLGRLTLNPLAHLDPFGTIAIILIGFGWAKPVPIDARNFKNKWAEFWVASAGPMMNVALAIFFATLLNFGVPEYVGGKNGEILANVCGISLFLNLALCFFNLIPIGPLDGSHIVARLLPLRQSLGFTQWNAQYGSSVLFGLIIFGMLTHIQILSYIVMVPVGFVADLLLRNPMMSYF